MRDCRHLSPISLKSYFNPLIKTRRREDGNGTYSLKRKTPINRNRYSKRSRQAITSSPISEPDSEQHVDEERLRVPKDNVGSSSPEHPFLHRRGGRRTKKGKGKSLRREAMDDNEYTMLLNSSSRSVKIISNSSRNQHILVFSEAFLNLLSKRQLSQGYQVGLLLSARLPSLRETACLVLHQPTLNHCHRMLSRIGSPRHLAHRR